MTGSEFFQLFLYPSNWDIPFNLIMIGIAVIYLVVTTWGHQLWSFATPVSRKKRVSFMVALVVYNLAQGSPLSMLGHELFSMHMLQMSLLYILFPPLFLLGIPAWFVRPLQKVAWLRSGGRFLTKPLVILFLFNGMISLYHVPAVFDAIMAKHLYHHISHIVLLILAVSMWYSVTCPVPESDRVKPLHKLGFIFANGVLLTPACALIIFASDPLFAMYSTMSTAVPVMTPLHDQQLGGVIMKIMQEVIYITAIGLIFMQWIRTQRIQDEQDLAEWMKDKEANHEKQTGDYSWN